MAASRTLARILARLQRTFAPAREFHFLEAKTTLPIPAPAQNQDFHPHGTALDKTYNIYTNTTDVFEAQCAWSPTAPELLCGSVSDRTGCRLSSHKRRTSMPI
jgi:hypothetical protein